MTVALTAFLFILLFTLGWHYGRQEGQAETVRAFRKQGYKLMIEALDREDEERYGQ